MTREEARAARQRSLNFPLLLMALLAGLFAMYGLGPHDEDHSDGHAPSLVALVSADDYPGQHHQEATTTDASLALDSGVSRESAPPGDGGPGLGECLALLGLLFALAISAVLAARRTRPLFILRRFREALVLRGRPPDPPCLHRLSILRC